MAQAKPSANSGVRINVSRTRYSIDCWIDLFLSKTSCRLNEYVDS